MPARFYLNGREFEPDLSKAVTVGPATFTIPDALRDSLHVGQPMSIEGVPGRVTRLAIERYPEPRLVEWSPGEWYMSDGTYEVTWQPD